MNKLQDTMGWNISDWQNYLREFGLKIVEAGDFNKKKWYFQASSRFQENKDKSQKNELYAGFRFILPNAWKY